MFIPKWRLRELIDSNRDLERRVNRLERIIFADAKNKIAGLRSRTGNNPDKPDGLTIEEIITSELRKINNQPYLKLEPERGKIKKKRCIIQHL